MEEIIRLVLEQDGFAALLLDCPDTEQAQEMLASQGLELSREEIQGMGRGLRNALCGADELDEDALDEAAGGLAALDRVATAVSVLTALAEEMPRVKKGFLNWR